MNQIKSDFEDIFFNPFNKSDSLFEDPNDPDSHYFDERDYDSDYLHVNEINTFLYDLTQHENLSLLELNIRSLRSNLDYFHTGHFNLNCLEFHHSSEIRQFFNDMFKKGAIPLINRPTRVTMTTFLRTAFLIHLSKTE